MPTIREMAVVAAGAAVGGVLRFLIAGAVSLRTTSFFTPSPHLGDSGAPTSPSHGFAAALAEIPWGTLTVNLSGCLLIGAAIPVLAGFDDPRSTWRLLIVVGILGGYTTLSAFALETLKLIRADHAGAAVMYIAITNVGAMAAITLGLLIGRMLDK